MARQKYTRSKVQVGIAQEDNTVDVFSLFEFDGEVDDVMPHIYEFQTMKMEDITQLFKDKGFRIEKVERHTHIRPKKEDYHVELF